MCKPLADTAPQTCWLGCVGHALLQPGTASDNEHWRPATWRRDVKVDQRAGYRRYSRSGGRPGPTGISVVDTIDPLGWCLFSFPCTCGVHPGARPWLRPAPSGSAQRAPAPASSSAAAAPAAEVSLTGRLSRLRPSDSGLQMHHLCTALHSSRIFCQRWQLLQLAQLQEWDGVTRRAQAFASSSATAAPAGRTVSEFENELAHNQLPGRDCLRVQGSGWEQPCRRSFWAFGHTSAPSCASCA